MRNINIYIFKPIIIGFLINICIFVYYTFKAGYGASIFAIEILLIFQSIFYFIPFIIISINYFLYSKKNELKYNKDKFILKRLGKTTFFSIEDIEKVEYNCSYSLYYKRPRFFFWDEFFYYKIILNSGKKIIITCLNVNNLEGVVPEKNIIRKKSFLPLIKKEGESF